MFSLGSTNSTSIAAICLGKRLVAVGLTCWSMNNASRSVVPLALLLIAVTSSVGCQTFRRHPVDEFVAKSREETLIGIEEWQRGRIDEAEQHLRDAVEVCPKNEHARRKLAEVLLEKGADDEAITHLEELLKLEAHDPATQVKLGQLYLRKGWTTSAASLADRALAADIQYANGWALRGMIAESQNDLDLALAHYQRALSYHEKMPEVQLSVAEIYRQKGEPLRAYATLRRLTRDLPEDQQSGEIQHLQGLALRELKRYRQAVESFERAVALEPENSSHYIQLAETQWLNGDKTNAQLTLLAARQRFPRDQQIAELQHRADSDRYIIR